MEEKKEEIKTYSVYVHTNLTNNKKYVGITKRNPKERWHSDGSGYSYNLPFWKDIRLFGWKDGFSHEIVATGLTCYEACKMEMELIKEYDSFKHGYNRSLGGEGIEGHVVGAPLRERMSPDVYAVWAANNAERMKRLGIERTRKVISLTENVIYDSAVEASEKTGVPTERIRGMCNKAKRTNFYDSNGFNYRFCWYEDDFDMTKDEFTIAYYPKCIICLDTKQVFASGKEVERVMGIANNLVTEVCNGTWISTHGHKFIYYKDYLSGKRDTRISKNIEKNRREVICLETGEIYYNCAKASKELGFELNMISRAAKNFKFTCKGYHFAYLEDYEKNPELYILPEAIDKTVLQFDKFGKFIAEYPCYQKAAKELGVDEKNVHASCRSDISKRYICADSLWMFKRDYNKDALYNKVKSYWNHNKSSKCVGQFDLEGNLLNIYSSTTNAANVMDCFPASIGQCCRNEKRTIKGYKWRYISPMTYLDEQMNKSA